jgi:hypothetical protein
VEETMSIEEAVVEKLRSLPVDKQLEVLDFAEFLHAKAEPGKPRRSLKGIWSDLNIDITEDDIAEMRREAWANFPRDIEL